MHVLNDNLGACNVVLLLHELHRRGYEQLRLFCGWAPSGLYWRWNIYPKCLMLNDANWEKHDDCTPFDCPHGTAIRPQGNWNHVEAADELLRNAKLLELGKLPDEEYVRWYAQIAEHAKRGEYPVAFGEFFPSNDSWLFEPSQEKLPYPPFTPTDLDAASDEWVFKFGKYALDELSRWELRMVNDFEGIVPPLHGVAQVIRQCVRENKRFCTHTDLAIEQETLYKKKDIAERREEGSRIYLKLKDGKEVELVDTLEICAWSH